MMKLRQKPRKYAIVLTLLLALGLAVNVVAAVPDQAEIEKILTQQIEAMNRCDVDAALNNVVDMRQSTEETKKLYAELVKDDSEIPRSFEVNKLTKQLTKNSFLITADCNITFKDGHSRVITLYFKQFQGEWKLFIHRQEENVKAIDLSL